MTIHAAVDLGVIKEYCLSSNAPDRIIATVERLITAFNDQGATYHKPYPELTPDPRRHTFIREGGKMPELAEIMGDETIISDAASPPADVDAAMKKALKPSKKRQWTDNERAFIVQSRDQKPALTWVAIGAKLGTTGSNAQALYGHIEKKGQLDIYRNIPAIAPSFVVAVPGITLPDPREDREILQEASRDAVGDPMHQITFKMTVGAAGNSSGLIGKRPKNSPLQPVDLVDIHDMLTAGKDMDDIAETYGTTKKDVEAFVLQHRNAQITKATEPGYARGISDSNHLVKPSFPTRKNRV